MNPQTAAAVIGLGLANSAIISELVALLSADQKELLRLRLQARAQSIEPITEYEPDCSSIQREHLAEWDRLLAPKP